MLSRTLLLSATLALTVAPAHADGPPDARAIADRAAMMLHDNYIDPALGTRYAATLRSHAARGDYAALSDPQALADRMTADLQAVARDGHLRFYVSRPETPPPAAASASTSAQPDRSPAPGIREIKWAAPGVAYIAFEHFDDRPEAIAAVTRFLTDYASARALIIDSRGNHGGAFDMMGVLANHLFAAPRLLANMDMAQGVVEQHGAPFPIDGQVMRRTDGPAGLVRFQHWVKPATDNRAWFDKPVYYLTSRETFSAAEHMAMVLKSTHRATLIGETTGGGNHFGGTEPVGGGLELFVPIGHTTDPATGKDWEGTGIAPDVAVPRDRALDEALRRIAATASQPIT